MLFRSAKNLLKQVNDLDTAINEEVAKLAPEILDERRFLGLAVPDSIKVKAEISERQFGGYCMAHEDFIHLTLGPFFHSQLSTRNSKSMYFFARFASFADQMLIERMTLEGSVSLLLNPSPLEALTFDHLSEEGQHYYRSLRKDILSDRDDLLKSTTKLLPELTTLVRSEEFAGKVEDIIRHETHHLAAPTRHGRREIESEGKHRYLEQQRFVSGRSNAPINWADELHAYGRMLPHVFEGTVDEESLAFFFSFIPKGGWNKDAINAAAQRVHLAIDFYNPTVFIAQALIYEITKENQKRAEMGNALVHPFGNEVWHILHKMYNVEGNYFPFANPAKTDIGFVQKLLYEAFPLYQQRFLAATNKFVEEKRQYLLERARG